MKKLNIFLSIIVGALILVSCNKETEWDKELNKEDTRIEQYLLKNNLNISPEESGLYYIETKEGDGIMPQSGDYVIYDFTYWLLDSTLISTSDSNIAKLYDIYNDELVYGRQTRQVGYYFSPGESEGFTNMKENGECKLIIPFEIGSIYYPTYIYPAYSTMLVNFKLHKVVTDPEVYEQQILDTFLLNNPDYTQISNIEGLYYKQTTAGNGIAITSSSQINMTFTIYMIDGRKVIEETDDIYYYDVTLPGLKNGLLLMTEGENGVLLMRSDLAYDNRNDLVIPPYTSVLFDITINEVNY